MRRLIGFLKGLMVPALAFLMLAFVPPGTASAATVSTHQEVRSYATPTIEPTPAHQVAVNIRSTVGASDLVVHPVDYGVVIVRYSIFTMTNLFNATTDDGFNTSAATLTGRSATDNFNTPAVVSRRADKINFYARRDGLRRT
jgi:hypothetical protein